jgi:hypothetical protein
MILYKFCGVLENLCSIWSGSGSEAGTENFLSWNRNKSKRFHNTVLICEMLESVNGNRCITVFFYNIRELHFTETMSSERNLQDGFFCMGNETLAVPLALFAENRWGDTLESTFYDLTPSSGSGTFYLSGSRSGIHSGSEIKWNDKKFSTQILYRALCLKIKSRVLDTAAATLSLEMSLPVPCTFVVPIMRLS